MGQRVSIGLPITYCTIFCRVQQVLKPLYVTRKLILNKLKKTFNHEEHEVLKELHFESGKYYFCLIGIQISL